MINYALNDRLGLAIQDREVTWEYRGLCSIVIVNEYSETNEIRMY